MNTAGNGGGHHMVRFSQATHLPSYLVTFLFCMHFLFLIMYTGREGDDSIQC